MTTVFAGTSQTFTATDKGTVFTVQANGGAIGLITGTVNGASLSPTQVGPTPMCRSFGPLAFGDSVVVQMQIGSASVEASSAPPNGWGNEIGAGVFSSIAALSIVDASSFPIGVRAYVGPDSSGQYAEWYSNGKRWRPRSGIFAMKNTSGSVTDLSTSEQDVYALVIPASLIGPNDDIYIDSMWTWPNSATTKTMRVKFGGTAIAVLAATTTASGRWTSHIYMRDSKSAQIYSNSASSLAAQEGQTSSSTPSTATIDTSTDITVNLTAQWGTSGAGSNLITLERVAIGLKFAY